MIAEYFASASYYAQQLRSIIFLVPPYKLRVQHLLDPLSRPLRILLKYGQIISLGKAFFPFKPDFRPSYYRGFHKIDQKDIVRSPKSTARHFLSLIKLMSKFPHQCKSINKPLLAMIGTNDQILDPKGVKDLVYSLRNIKRKLVIFKGSDHSLMFDKNSQKSYDIIESWLRRH